MPTPTARQHGECDTSYNNGGPSGGSWYNGGSGQGSYHGRSPTAVGTFDRRPSAIGSGRNSQFNLSFGTATVDSNPGTWTGLNGTTLNNSTWNFALNASGDPLLPGSLADVQNAANAAGISFGDTYSDHGVVIPVDPTKTDLTVVLGGIASSKPIVFTNNALNYTINSPDALGITGSTSVYLAGTGMVTFTGTHTYIGGTTISSGTLQLGDTSGHDGTLTTSAIANNAPWSTTWPAARRPIMTSTAAAPLTGPGSLSLAGNVSYTGNTTVSGGTLELHNALNFSNGNNPANTVSIASGAVLDFYTDSNGGRAGNGDDQAFGTQNTTTLVGAGTFQKTGGGVLGVSAQTTVT